VKQAKDLEIPITTIQRVESYQSASRLPLIPESRMRPNLDSITDQILEDRRLRMNAER